ncbi:MAG: ribonuclease III [Anaerolineaceae bacterium]
MTEPDARSRFYQNLPPAFNNHFLLTRALTHRSYINENRGILEDNERLEFLGDAILNQVVAEWLYHHFPEKQEGFLTKLRSALVHTKQLADFAREIDLGSVLLLGKGEDLAGGRNRNAILCDAFEALIAAIYLSTDMETVKGFFYPFIDREIQSILSNHSEEDSKSLLQEWAQAHGFQSPVYALTAESGPDHDKVFTIQVLINDEEVASGSGGSKQLAEKAAAVRAIKRLGISD